MPWLAPEFKEGKKDSHFKAYKDYGVTELPCLVIVKNDGKTVQFQWKNIKYIIFDVYSIIFDA